MVEKTGNSADNSYANYIGIMNTIDKWIGPITDPSTGESVDINMSAMMQNWAFNASFLITIAQALRGSPVETCPKVSNKLFNDIIGNRAKYNDSDVFPYHFENVIRYVMESIEIRKKLDEENYKNNS